MAYLVSDMHVCSCGAGTKTAESGLVDYISDKTAEFIDTFWLITSINIQISIIKRLKLFKHATVSSAIRATKSVESEYLGLHRCAELNVGRQKCLTVLSSLMVLRVSDYGQKSHF